MTLDRTSVRHQALQMVRNRTVVWQQSTPAGIEPVRSAGFAHASGGRVADLHLLIALCEAEDEGWIVRRGLTVSLTDAGRQVLSVWARAQVRS